MRFGVLVGGGGDGQGEIRGRSLRPTVSLYDVHDNQSAKGQEKHRRCLKLSCDFRGFLWGRDGSNIGREWRAKCGALWPLSTCKDPC